MFYFVPGLWKHIFCVLLPPVLFSEYCRNPPPESIVLCRVSFCGVDGYLVGAAVPFFSSVPFGFLESVSYTVFVGA